MYKFKSKFNNFLELTRAYSLPLSLSPLFVALCWALDAQPGALNITLVFLAIICLHLATNLFDDYIDLKRELKKGAALSDVTFAGAPQKARLIKAEVYSLSSVFKIISSLYFIAILTGVYFTFLLGYEVVAIALVAALLCALYPFLTKWKPGGLGEVVLAILFGPLLTYGAYFALVGTHSLSLQLFSLTLALLIANVGHVHSLMDFENDIARGKRTLCTMFKTKQNARKVTTALIALAYFNMAALLALGYLPPLSAVVFFTLPTALKLVHALKVNEQGLEDSAEDSFFKIFSLARSIPVSVCIVVGLVYIYTYVIA
ncbi:1,4-dihydroxy-2-naphthoate octaprenyltransferase [Candidatus Gastranaerophilus sp. (ex Termes propinquus)]|nr:1,4-dihydroxy-2-naphthoate octaprenyltransferase [Candidatus Gastranaerophilus sp. (ex Termes propinquus)]